MRPAYHSAWPPYDAWLEVDLGALRHNAQVLRRAVPRRVQIGAVVKANAYGHGLAMAAITAAAAGVDWLIVATLSEGLEIRSCGIGIPILVLYPVPPKAVTIAARAGLTLTVSGKESARALVEAWRRLSRDSGLTLQVHLEVDTGLGRGGGSPKEIAEVASILRAATGIVIKGIWSHLTDGTNRASTANQVAMFRTAVSRLHAAGCVGVARHLLATDGFIAGSAPLLDLVRVGLAFYGELGMRPLVATHRAELVESLRPAIALKARPVRLERVATGSTVGYGSEWRAERPSRIATVPLGYADGLRRSLWPGAEVLVRGRRVPIVGRISMDAICIDVTEAEPVTLDTEFVLLGRQGANRITVNELAAQTNTIPNEILASLGPRLARIYVDEGRVVAGSRFVSELEPL